MFESYTAASEDFEQYSGPLLLNKINLPNLINAPTYKGNSGDVFYNWLNGTAEYGVIYQNQNATWDKNTQSMYIPKKWVVTKNNDKCAVNVTSNSPDNVTISGTGIYTTGSTVTITATPRTGYEITEWYDNDAQQPIQVQGNSYTFQATEDRSITVRLVEDETVTITANALPQGIATITGGGTYYVGDTVTLIANNADLYDIEWSNGQTGDTISFTATTDETYTATYIKTRTLITGSTIQSGLTIEGLGVYNIGDTVTLNIKGKIPSLKIFDKWSVQYDNVQDPVYYEERKTTFIATVNNGEVTMLLKDGFDENKDYFTVEVEMEEGSESLYCNLRQFWLGDDVHTLDLWYNVDNNGWQSANRNTIITLSHRESPKHTVKFAGKPSDGYTVGNQCSGTTDFSDSWIYKYYQTNDESWIESLTSLSGHWDLQEEELDGNGDLAIRPIFRIHPYDYTSGDYKIKVRLKGKLVSLINSNCYDDDEGDFRNLFASIDYWYDNYELDVSKLIFPKNSLYSDYTGMFAYTKCLKDASKLKLPSNAVPGGFEYMFARSDLQVSPTLKPTQLTEDTYKDMFYGCNNLDTVKTQQLTEMDAYNQAEWLADVAEEGTIYFNKSIHWDPEIYRGAATDEEGELIYGYPVKWNYAYIGNTQGELGLDGLFIDGQRVDEFNDMDVSMTYQSRHTSSPEAVRSNFSKTVTLPGTPNNNNIFGNLYNPNATLTNFNPRERVEFKLYRNSEIVEKGYITLDEIVTDKDGNITYNVTLYGGLGDFFYSLQYDENGDELTLDLLSYPLTMENNHIVCFWDFEHIKQGWEKLKLPFDKNDRTPENYIVACPTYGGFGDDMDNNKAILLSKWYNGPDDEYGWNFWNGPVVTDYTPDQGEHFYSDRNGWIGVEAQREMSEWETRDLRSSQQRPAIRTKLIFDAICDPVNNGGYTVELSQSLSADTYLNDSWIVCDRLDFDNGDSNLNPIIVKSYKDRVITATVAPAVQMTEDEDEFDLSGMSNVHLQLCAYPMMYVENTQHVLQDSVREIFTAMETRAYARDSEDNLIMRYTPVYSTVLKHYIEGDEYTSTQYHVFDQVYVANAYVFWLTDNYGHKSNVQVLMNHLIKDGFWVIEDEYKEYIAQWANVNTNQVTIHNVPIKKRRNARGDVWFVTEDVMPLTIDLPSESDVKVQYHSEVIAIPFAITKSGKKYNLSDCMYYNKTTPDFSVDTTGQLPSWDWNKDEINRRVLTEWKVNVEQPRYDLWTIEDEQQDYEQFTAWRWDTFYISTGDNTQDDNFGSSYQAWQPIRYLDTWYEPIEDKDNEGAENGFYEGQLQSVQSTAVTKELLFGRMGTAYNFLMTLSKLLSLRFRMDKDDKKVYIERVFEYYKDNTIDITDRVDYSKEIKVIPNVTEYKYLDYTLESPEDLYINKLYNTKYHKPYGGYKFNTGINLSNDTNEIFESSPFNSTAEYNMKSPYFFINERVPQPYLLPYVQQTLYLDEAGSTSSSQVQTLERNGYSSIYRLNQIEGPTLLCMYDKEYKAVDTNMVLAFFNGFTPWKCIVSDNIKAMNELQNKNCVMSMYMHFADDISDVVAVSPAQQGFVPYLDGYIYGKPSTKTDSTERIAALMEDIPQFITTSNGKSTLISEPEHPFTEVGECIYPQYHMWSEDMYDRNGKKVELYMRMPKDIKPDEMLRNFIYWQNSIWVLESIEDYDIAKPDTVKVTLIKVRNKGNYLLNED